MSKTAEAQTLLNELMQTLTDRGRALLARVRSRPENKDLVELADLLLSRRGEASGVALARTLLDAYERAPPSTRLLFLITLAERFGPDRERLRSAIDLFESTEDFKSVVSLRSACEPRRLELLRRLNLAAGGTLALVRMRAELLENLKDHPGLAEVDADFLYLFSSWFNRGFLEMRHIQWTTSANILEKIIRYEAVHPLAGWSDLKRRINPADRRCFAFFHPQLADEPLIFVEVALTSEIPTAVAPLLAADREPIDVQLASTAIFYSISNAQRGLAGVSFGHFLIKQVVEDLKREIPGLKNFVTLSPVPGFAEWLKKQCGDPKKGNLDREIKALLDVLDDPRWFENPASRATAEHLLRPIAGVYFVNAKSESGRPIDPVARFHLGNGARLERINFLGDTSDRGMKQSYGLMVNYAYDIGTIEQNHEAYAEAGEIAASSAVKRLARSATVRERQSDGV